MQSPSMILITGVMAAGKSTVAQALAEALPRSVHLRGDLFRRMIVNGRAEMGFALSAEALAQLELRYQLAAQVAHGYVASGFTVVYQDIILGATLTAVIDQLRGDQPLYVVVLCPTPAVVAQREANRNKQGYGSPTEIGAFDQVLHAETPRLGLWVDSSTWTVAETVAYILANLSAAQV